MECKSKSCFMCKIVSEDDQEIPQLQTSEKTKAL